MKRSWNSFLFCGDSLQPFLANGFSLSDSAGLYLWGAGRSSRACYKLLPVHPVAGNIRSHMLTACLNLSNLWTSLISFFPQWGWCLAFFNQFLMINVSFSVAVASSGKSIYLFSFFLFWVGLQKQHITAVIRLIYVELQVHLLLSVPSFPACVSLLDITVQRWRVKELFILICLVFVTDVCHLSSLMCLFH